MASFRQRGVLAGIVIGSSVVAVLPASAFEIFGIRLWGQPETADQVEVIDPLPYTVMVQVSTGDEAMQKALERSSALWNNRERPASGNAGLITMARGDYRRILAALYGEGYYGGEISILIGGREAADMTLAEAIPMDVPVAIRVEPGPLFTFGRTDIINGPPFGQVRSDDEVDGPATVGFAPGETALSGAINAASLLAVQQWRELAHAKARETERDVTAVHPTRQVDASITIDPGRKAHFGPLRVAGQERMDAAFIAYIADLPEGEDFDPDRVRTAEDRLGRLGVFNSIRLDEAEEIEPDGTLPFTLTVEERRRRTYGFGATYSSLDGFGASAYAMHRNLFGRAERLRLDTSVGRIGETSDPADLDYSVALSFVRPGVINPDTNFGTSVIARQLELDTYDERSVTGRMGLSRPAGRWLTGEAFLEVSKARYVDDAFGTRHFTTVAVVGQVQYDRRDNALDATRGYYLAGDLRPSYEFEYGKSALRGTLEGRVYRAFGADRRFVLAGRAKVGSYYGPSIAESPPDQLFFTGGGGSIRGYAYRSIGIETELSDGDTETVGGKGLVEGSLEARARLWGNFGGVAFVDAGVVTADSNFGGADDLRYGAGVGLRYYTGFGPLRFDVAAPIDPRDEDSAVAVYIGIGQAF